MIYIKDTYISYMICIYLKCIYMYTNTHTYLLKPLTTFLLHEDKETEAQRG